MHRHRPNFFFTQDIFATILFLLYDSPLVINRSQNKSCHYKFKKNLLRNKTQKNIALYEMQMAIK